MRFWYKPDFPEATWIYTSLNSVYLWGSTLHNMQFPEVTVDPNTGKEVGISSGLTVVILSRCGGVFEEARRGLGKIGTDALLLKEKTMRHRNVSYTITLVKTLDAGK